MRTVLAQKPARELELRGVEAAPKGEPLPFAGEAVLRAAILSRRAGAGD